MLSMDGVVVLTCPNCGAPLRITDGLEQFACSHCGTEQIVKRSGGIVTLQPLMAAVSRVESAASRAAAELAIQRLTGEIAAAKAEVAKYQKVYVNDVAPPSLGEHIKRNSPHCRFAA
jgi:primosomal protein N'